MLGMKDAGYEVLEDDGGGPFGDRNGVDKADAGSGNDDNCVKDCDLLGDDEHV